MISYSVKSDPIQSLIKKSQLGFYYAIHDGMEFNSVFQPLYNGCMKIIGYEALIRININDEQISPQVFFDRIENDFEKDLFYFLLTAKLHLNNFSLFNKGALLFLNSSPNVFNYLSNNEMAFERLFERLAELKINPDKLIYELTEKNNDNLDITVVGKKHLNNEKIRIAVDDYGSGFFNIDVVRAIEPNIIKLDRSIIKELSEYKGLKKIEEVMRLKNHFDFKVVAEGIEKKEELDILKRLNIDIFQGYYLSKPIRTIDLIN